MYATVCWRQPRTIEERVSLCNQFLETAATGDGAHPAEAVAVDTLANEAVAAYNPMPERLYIIQVCWLVGYRRDIAAGYRRDINGALFSPRSQFHSSMFRNNLRTAFPSIPATRWPGRRDRVSGRPPGRQLPPRGGWRVVGCPHGARR